MPLNNVSELDHLRQLFEQAPGFMAMLRGPRHVFELVNPAYLQLIGHRQVLGMSVRDALPEVDGQGVFEPLDEVYRSGKPYIGSDVEVSLRTSEGSVPARRFLEFVYQPVRDAAGIVNGIFVQGSDITARVETQQLERETESRNRQILDSAVDFAIVALDLEGRVARWNEGAHRIFGWTEAEMLGEHVERIFTPEDGLAGRPEVEMRMARTTGAGNDERWHIRQSGERFWAQGEMTPILGAGGQLSGYVKVLQDRSAQHQSEIALRESQASLQRAQRVGGVGTFSLAIPGDVLTPTPEFCRLFGLPARPEIAISDFERLVVPDDRKLGSTAETRNNQNVDLNVEYRIKRASDGVERWISRVAEFERDASGKVVRMVGVAQDITDRKAALQAVEDSARQFHEFAQAMPNHVWTATPDGLLDWFNDRVYAYSGAASGTLDGQGWTSLVHPDDLQDSAASWATSLAEGTNYETEFRLRDAKGEYRWHLARAIPMKDRESRIDRWIGTNTDIHDRKLADEHSKGELDRVWSLSRELMLVCDFQGVISAVNPAATRLLGWTPAEMAGHSITEFIHPEDMPSTVAEVGKLSDGATTLSFENRYLTKDGEYRMFNWAAVPAADFIHAVGRDITQQRAAEDALRQSQKMEAVGQLTGGIAHDFNNLLTSITGSLEFIQRRVAQGRLGEVERFITTAQRGAQRAAALTHRLLAFSRRQTLDPKPTSINRLLADMEDLIRRTVGPSVTIEVVGAGGLWQTSVDANQLENAVLNLCINARDAMPDGGRITIETANKWLDTRAAKERDLLPGQYVSLCVTDTGVGMTPEVMAKAFEPFFTTEPLGMGTGLGLSMIYGFVRQSGGQVRIYSELGRGTTMCLYFPRELQEVSQEEIPVTTFDSAILSRQETILVVDDEATLRMLMREVIEEIGFRVLEAEDGGSAMKLLQSDERVDLLLTDVGLPGGMNGRQVADAARVVRPDLKVIFVTGYAENAVVGNGHLEQGMTVLTKPFEIDALAKKIHELI